MTMVNLEGSPPDEGSSSGLQPPVLSQAPLNFGVMAQGERKTVQEVISNTSGQPMIWLAETGGTVWLTLAPDKGVLLPGGQQAINLTVDTSCLAVGEHTVSLTFTSEGDEASMNTEKTANVAVEQPAVAPPLVGLHFGSLLPNSSRTLGLIIGNSDQRTVNWTAKIENGGEEWLTLHDDSLSGTLQPDEQRTIYVTANPASLAPQAEGENPHTATLTFTSEAGGAASARVQIPVVTFISDQPFHDGGPKPPVANPSRLSFGPLNLSQQAGANSSTTLALTFTNSLENGQVKWAISAGQVSWLPVPASSGTLAAGATGTINVTVDTNGLTTGTYRTDLLITLNYDPLRADHGSTSAPVPVTLVVS
jgi:Viral BACON domain